MLRAVGLVALSIAAATPARAVSALELPDGGQVLADKCAIVWTRGSQRARFLLTHVKEPCAVDFAVHVLKGNNLAVHARAQDKNGAAVEAVVVSSPSKTARLVWQADTRLRGDMGERAGQALRFEDLDGDAVDEVVVGKVSESVRLCGQDELPLLFRSVLDISSLKFAPVAARRVNATFSAPIDGAPGADPAPALPSRWVSPRSASRFPGDQGDFSRLGPPVALTDGNPNTTWSPGMGPRLGEFATFLLSAAPYGLTHIGVRPFIDPVGRQRHDRPAELLLTTESGTFVLRFPQDPALHLGAVYWFELPGSVSTRCFSLVVEKSYAPGSSKYLPLAEVYARTELDSDDGLARLTRDLSDSKSRQAAAMLLRRFGQFALAPIRKAWPELGAQARQIAASVLVEVAASESADLIAQVAMMPGVSEPATAAAWVTAAGPRAIALVSAELGNKDPERAQRALDLLSRIDSEASLDALVAAAGLGSWAWRDKLRSHIGKAAGNSLDRAEQLWAHIERNAASSKREALLDLLRASAVVESLQDRAASICAAQLAAELPFEDQYRFLDALASTGCHAPAELLARLARSKDPKIREMAIFAMGSCGDSSSARSSALAAALRDEEPDVRAQALTSLAGGSLDAGAEDLVAGIGRKDPWPDVRARAVAVLARSPRPAATVLIGAAISDPSETVRRAALIAAGTREDAELDSAVESRIADKQEKPAVRALAARAAASRCQTNAFKALVILLAEGALPLASRSAIDSGIAAARALGAIGGLEGKGALERARKAANLAIQRAIDAALAEPRRECERPARQATAN